MLEADFDTQIFPQFAEDEVVHAGLADEEDIFRVRNGHVAEFFPGHVSPGDAVMVEVSVRFDEVEDAEVAEGAEDNGLVDCGSGGVREGAVLFEDEG